MKSLTSYRLMSTLAWLASQTSGPFLTMTLIQVMINVTRPDYAFTNWQYTLACLAFIASTVFFNTWAAKTLPLLEAGALWIHLFGFLVVIIPLWVLAPKELCLTMCSLSFVNDSGYSNMGTAVLLNQVYSLYCILGSDTAVHISEEVEGTPASLYHAACGGPTLSTFYHRLDHRR